MVAGRVMVAGRAGEAAVNQATARNVTTLAGFAAIIAAWSSREP
jgi:hypothetical protein